MAGSDDDKTVFGQRLPPSPARQRQQAQAPQGQPPAAGQPPQGQPPQGQPAARPAERTVFGQQLPPSPGQGRVAPQQSPQPRNNEDTWLGLNLGATPQPSYQQPSPPPQQNWGQPQQNWGQQPGNAWGAQQPAHGNAYPSAYQPQNLGSLADGMFPDINPAGGHEPQERVVPRISLEDALRATGLGAGGSSNILVAAAANLLILLGRLRTGLVEMEPQPLIEHVAREIDTYQRNVMEAGVSQQDAMDAKYALSATADDIVQNLPGADRSIWIQYSMIARFFGERSSGVGFFQKLDEAMRAPGQKFLLLELMLTCLSLGFEGQYRTAPNGSVELGRIRLAIYETLRRVHPRPDDDVSVRWQPVVVKGRRSGAGIPVWAVFSVCAALVVGTFIGLSWLLNRDGGLVQTDIARLHAGLPPITLERTITEAEPSPPAVREVFVAPPPAQLDRIRDALAEQIADGSLVVEPKGDNIMIRVGDVLHFASGRANLQEEGSFTPLAEAIAAAIENEPGALRIIGHTDSDRVSASNPFRNNEGLSLARAQTVADIVGQFLSEPDRISVEGMGDSEPVDPEAGNSTPEAKAANRRVEIMLPKEDVT